MKVKNLFKSIFIIIFVFTLTGCDFLSKYINKQISEDECAEHEFVEIEAKEPTCFESGHSSYLKCIHCGYFENYERLNQLKHSFVNMGTGYEICNHCKTKRNIGEITLSLLPLDQREFIKDLPIKSYLVFEEIYKAITNFEKTYTFKNKITIDELSMYMNLLNYGCPELIQLEGTYTYSYSERDNLISSVTFSYILNQSSYQKAYSDMMNIIEQLVKSCHNLSEYEKEYYIYNALIDMCTYDKTTLHSGSAYGLLVENKARCEGYSKAFSLLMWYLDIECFAVTGDANNIRHSWNVVNIENNYYYVDVTWDDQEENPSLYAFFNVDKQTMDNALHVLDDFYLKRVPICNSLYRSVFYQNNAIINDGENVKERLIEIFNSSIQKQENKIYIKVQSPTDFNVASSIIKSTFDNFIQSKYHTYSYNLLTHPHGMAFLIDVSYRNPK